MVTGKHQAEPDDTVDVGGLLKVFIRKQVDVALTERLQALRERDGRRAPQGASPPESMGPQYLTREQVAQLTGYSSRTVTRWIATGKLRACGPRRDRVTRVEVDRFMATIQDDDLTPSPLNGGAGGAQLDPDADVTAAVDSLMSLK